MDPVGQVDPGVPWAPPGPQRQGMAARWPL